MFAVGPSTPPRPEFTREATDLTEEGISQALDAADRRYQQGYAPQSVIAAWAAVESAMRHRLGAKGSDEEWGTMPRNMLGELVSSGSLSCSDYRRLLDLFYLRNVIVHGFAVPEIDPSFVPFLTSAASPAHH